MLSTWVVGGCSVGVEGGEWSKGGCGTSSRDVWCLVFVQKVRNVEEGAHSTQVPPGKSSNNNSHT